MVKTPNNLYIWFSCCYTINNYSEHKTRISNNIIKKIISYTMFTKAYLDLFINQILFGKQLYMYVCGQPALNAVQWNWIIRMFINQINGQFEDFFKQCKKKITQKLKFNLYNLKILLRNVGPKLVYMQKYKTLKLHLFPKRTEKKQSHYWPPWIGVKSYLCLWQGNLGTQDVLKMLNLNWQSTKQIRKLGGLQIYLNVKTRQNVSSKSRKILLVS